MGRALCAMLGPGGGASASRADEHSRRGKQFEQIAGGRGTSVPTVCGEDAANVDRGSEEALDIGSDAGLIQCRNGARTAKDLEAEADYNKRIRSSARADRRRWLEDLAATDNCTRIQKPRTKPRPQQGRLKDAAGNIVSSEHRAETMAEYFESVQWAVRPVTAHRFEEHLGEELPVNCGPITKVEVRRAAKRLKNNRACGLDNVPAEFWKALFCTAGPAATWATEFYK